MSFRACATVNVMFEVEPGGESREPCGCCGGLSYTLWGYVRDPTEGARAVYYVGWVENGHDEDKVLRMTFSLGRWGEETSGSDRHAVAMEMRAPDGVPGMAVVDPEHVLFDKPEVLGRVLTRDAALDNPELSDLWDIADAVVLRDQRVEQAVNWLKHA